MSIAIALVEVMASLGQATVRLIGNSLSFSAIRTAWRQETFANLWLIRKNLQHNNGRMVL